MIFYLSFGWYFLILWCETIENVPYNGTPYPKLAYEKHIYFFVLAYYFGIERPR